MFWERFELLCSEMGVKPNRAAAEMGISSASITKWKNGTTPGNDNLKKISAYFGVTIDWLNGNSQFRTQQELAQCFASWEYSGIDDFNPSFEFCSLLKPLREKMNITTVEMGYVIGLTQQQYELCENGFEPITQSQAEDLCKFLDTNIEQVLFENGQFILDEDIPYEEQDDIKGYLQRKQAAEDEAMRECYQNAPDSNDDETLALIARNARNLTPENRKKLLEMARLMFGEEFEDNGHTS